MTNSKIEQMIRKLVSRFFKRAGEEVVTSDVIWAVAFEKQFQKFTKEERTEIVLESISRLEGEYSLEYAMENIHDYWSEYFADPLAV